VKTKRTRGSNNVFRDLGFSAAQAENLRIRSAMMTALIAQLEKKRLTQAQAAKLLGVSQPRISDLTRGKIQLFSIDTLVNMLAAAGLKIDLRVGKAA
jgi:predicted XRE-type DNA-binding protein